MDLADLQRLVDAFEASDWNEIHLAVDGVEVHLSAAGGRPPSGPARHRRRGRRRRQRTAVPAPVVPRAAARRTAAPTPRAPPPPLTPHRRPGERRRSRGGHGHAVRHARLGHRWVRRPPPDGGGAGARPVARHLLALARPGPAAVRRGRHPRGARHRGLHRRADEAHEPRVGGPRGRRHGDPGRQRGAGREGRADRLRLGPQTGPAPVPAPGPGGGAAADAGATPGGARERAQGARRQPRARSPCGSCGRASTRAIESVAAVSDADRDSLAARRADAVVRIGPAAASASYLDVGAIVGAAIATGCDAVHPGYGFLSERPELAAECAAGGPDVRRAARRGHPPRRQQDRRAGARPLDRRAGGRRVRPGRHAERGRRGGGADRLPGAAQGVGGRGRPRHGPGRRRGGARAPPSRGLA